MSISLQELVAHFQHPSSDVKDVLQGDKLPHESFVEEFRPADTSGMPWQNALGMALLNQREVSDDLIVSLFGTEYVTESVLTETMITEFEATFHLTLVVLDKKTTPPSNMKRHSPVVVLEKLTETEYVPIMSKTSTGWFSSNYLLQKLK